MRSHHMLALAMTAGFITLPVAATHHGQRSESSVVPETQKFCRMFEPAHWDNRGFVVTCGQQRERTAVPVRRCPMFNPPAWDNAGFTVACERETVAAAPPLQTCPMFTPPMWDNTGFRVPC